MPLSSSLWQNVGNCAGEDRADGGAYGDGQAVLASCTWVLESSLLVGKERQLKQS